MLRWIIRIVLGFGATVIAAVAAAYLLVGHFDLAPLAARRLTAALGRQVTIAGLHLTPGQWIAIDLNGVQVANVAGGSRPAMVELGHLAAEVEARSLLHGPLVVRQLQIDGLTLLFERTATERTVNWNFAPGPDQPQAAPAPASRSRFPTLLNAHLRDGQVTYRTAKGHEFRVRLDDLAILTEAADQPVRLTIAGAYNGTPVNLTSELQPFDVLRDDATAYGTNLHFASADTTLDLKGTMTDPLNADGVRGALVLKAPTPGPIFALAGIASDLDVSLNLAGSFEHSDNLWQLSGAAGDLKGNPITSASLRLTEGSKGKPDDAALNIVFDQIDLNGLRRRKTGAPPSGDADVSLDIDRNPDTLVNADLSAGQVTYDKLRFNDAKLTAGLTPGRIAVQGLALTYLGARLQASGQVEAAEQGNGRVSADVGVSGADVQDLRRALGFGMVPLSGKLDAQVIAASNGATLNAATRQARVSAAVSMTNGGIARQVVEMASVDVRLLFRKPKGLSTISCLLGVLDMRAGVGTVQPLRIRAVDGAIAGSARFDLYRGTFDLTIGSQSPSPLALDIPVRIFGPFASPTVRPAKWSKTGRAMLATTDRVDQLPPGLKQFAQRNPCLNTR